MADCNYRAWESGRSFVGRYDDLELFVRTTDSARVEETSRFWLEGFTGSEFDASAAERKANVTIPEGKVRSTRLHTQCHARAHTTST